MHKTSIIILLLSTMPALQSKTIYSTDMQQEAQRIYNVSREEGKQQIFQSLRPLAASAAIVIGSVLAVKKGTRFLRHDIKKNADNLAHDWKNFVKHGTVVCAMGATGFFAFPTAMVAAGLGMLMLHEGVSKLPTESVEDIAARLKREQEDNNRLIEQQRDAQRIARNRQIKLSSAKKN